MRIDSTIVPSIPWYRLQARAAVTTTTIRADVRFDVQAAESPNAFELAFFMQIDHTCVNAMVVAELSQTPLGRPRITLAIDVSSQIEGHVYFFRSVVNS